MPFIILGILTIGIISGTVYGWTYTNSSEFCGTTCHTMPPEYSAYQRSPHARVACVECHIGRDVVTTQFSRKAGDLRHVYLTLTQDYEFPIFSRAMRPARESCETCHFPEKFSDDSLREIQSYESDQANTKESIFLVLKTGGGSKREGLGRGIHWHVENEVWYLATDYLEQDIPYVRVVNDDGSVTEYYDIASGLTPDDVAGQFLERVDCITCHNRITHSIPNPDEAINEALRKGLISAELPFVREKAGELLSVKYETLEEANEAFAALEAFYSENYPEVYAEQSDAVQEAVDVLKDMYSEMVFPEQELDWETHPDNLGHKDSAGCFRCHDGKHLSGTEEAIRLECNLCHSVPVTAVNTLTTNIEIAQGPEPTSHTHSSWIALHGRSIDSSCAACHQPADSSVDYTELEGKPPADGSFCGNVACHANEWVYSGLDDPMLEPVLARQLYILLNTSPYLLDGVSRTYEGTFKALFDGRCTFCHSGPQAEADLDLSSYASIMRGGKSGPAITPGDPANSLMVQKQSGALEHFGQMLDEELQAVKEWIAAGAPE
ncbi:MAG: NapC/NirT family cytochrome c [Anaerolineales bacterium]|nr:NapC/NirT family cytochrome c [Anaerolineales bacterium]